MPSNAPCTLFAHVNVLPSIASVMTDQVWAIGLLASGQSSTMTGVTTGQYVMSGFLQIQMKPWQRIILTRSIALIPSVSVALASLGEESTLDATSQAVNVVMSVLIPFAILPLLHFTSSRTLMGSFVNTRWMMCVGWGFAVLVMGINFYLVVVTLQQAGVNSGAWVGFTLAAVVYVCMVALLVKDEARAVLRWGREKVANIRSRRELSVRGTNVSANEPESRRVEEVEQLSEQAEAEAVEREKDDMRSHVQDEKVSNADGEVDGTVVSGLLGVELTSATDTWKQ